MQGFIKIIVIAAISITAVSQAEHMDKETIDSRTSPVGQVHIEGMVQTQPTTKEIVTTAPAENMAAATTGGRTGEAVYNSFCLACHSIGLANAPKTGDADAWGKLLEAGGIDGLVASAKKGKNVMPPMGTCADCSDEEMKQAILFMSK